MAGEAAGQKALFAVKQQRAVTVPDIGTIVAFNLFFVPAALWLQRRSPIKREVKNHYNNKHRHCNAAFYQKILHIQ